MPLPDQLQKGHTFADGDTVNAALLNSIVDEAAVLKGTISEQTTVTADPADYVLITDTSAGGALKKALISTVVGAGGVTSVAMTAAPSGIFNISGSPITTTGTLALSLDQQEEDADGQNTVLACPATGDPGNPSFRRLLPKDFTNPARSIPLYLVDCLLGTVFFKQLPTGSHTITLNNGIPGQVFKVWVQRPSTLYTAGFFWDSDGDIRWPGGTTPTLTQAASAIDIFTFTVVGTNHYYGTVDQNFLL